MRYLGFVVIFILAVSRLHAQVSVSANIDTMEILIGEQVDVKVSVVADKSSKVIFPHYKPEAILTPGVEIISTTDEKLEKLDHSKNSITKYYRVTSFDDKLYYLPPFEVEVDGKKYKSKSLALKVLAVQVDTTDLTKSFGPKDVQDNPFLWEEWSRPFWASVLAFAMTVLGLFLGYRIYSGKVVIPSFKMIRRLSPHKKAMNAIDKIKAEKLTIAENPKEYYTKLTDAIREYIQERYAFNALEMTSSQIIEHLLLQKKHNDLEDLKQLFQTADLVKFAKYSTLINENDRNLVNAINFINATRIENEPEEQILKQQMSSEDKQVIRNRKIEIWMMATLFTVAACLYAYVIYMFVQI